jgi:hypothetical protein
VEYRTVFDITEAGYRAWLPLGFGLLFVAIGIRLVFFPNRMGDVFTGEKRLREQKPRFVRVFSWFFFAFSAAWTLTVFASTYGEYKSLISVVKSGHASVVEGVVSQFHPMPASGHDNERFCVGNNCFEYSDFEGTAAFNNTSSHGGPIREGLPVRVTFVGNAIVKLEVAKQ